MSDYEHEERLNPGFGGRKHTEESKRKMARSAAAQNARRGRNVPSIIHGGYAVTAVQEDVADLAAVIFGAAPWLHPVRDAFVVEIAARNILRARRLDLYLRDQRELTVGLALAAQQRSSEAAAMKALDALGLSPRAAAALGLDIASIREKTRSDATSTLARYRPKTVEDRE